jgi:hypothetical protein
MNHSFYSVDRTTHLKIVVIALIGATAIAGTGIAARTGSEGLTETAHASVIKLGSPAMTASPIQLAIR